MRQTRTRRCSTHCMSGLRTVCRSCHASRIRRQRFAMRSRCGPPCSRDLNNAYRRRIYERIRESTAEHEAQLRALLGTSLQGDEQAAYLLTPALVEPGCGHADNGASRRKNRISNRMLGMCPLGARYKRMSCGSANGFNAYRYSGLRSGQKVARSYR